MLQKEAMVLELLIISCGSLEVDLADVIDLEEEVLWAL
jgi:hypothetical protein